MFSLAIVAHLPVANTTGVLENHCAHIVVVEFVVVQAFGRATVFVVFVTMNATENAVSCAGWVIEMNDVCRANDGKEEAIGKRWR